MTTDTQPAINEATVEALIVSMQQKIDAARTRRDANAVANEIMERIAVARVMATVGRV